MSRFIAFCMQVLCSIFLLSCASAEEKLVTPTKTSTSTATKVCPKTAAGQRSIYMPGCSGAGCGPPYNDPDCAFCVYDMDACTKAFGLKACQATYDARKAQGVIGCNTAPPAPTPPPTPAPPAPPTPGNIPEYDNAWKSLISGTQCSNVTVTPKSGGSGGTITCEINNGMRHFKFPVGKFDIDEQVIVPQNTEIEGNANPNDPSDKSKKPDPATQTYFVATSGVTDPNAAYCGTHQNLQLGQAQKLRIGFLLNSNTHVSNLNFQGRDTVRPQDNGNLCGGGVFETPGCVSPGFGDGKGDGWDQKRNGCYDHTGQPNSLITGDGKGVDNVSIENVRLNDLLLPTDPHQYVGAPGSQLAVWVAMTQDGSATTQVKVTNVVSMLSHADGVNLHGNVQNSVVDSCHIENTGDDIYAMWGAYAANPSGVTFSNNVGKNPGATRNYMYGTCLAVYGAMGVTIVGNTCYDLGQDNWNPGQPDAACQNGKYCNSCFAYVHDGWFGAIYPAGNTISIHGNQYMYLTHPNVPIPPTDRPQIRSDPNSAAHIVTQSAGAIVV